MEDMILSLDPRARMEKYVRAHRAAGDDLLDGLTEAVVTQVAEHVNLTRAHARLQALARALICATFLEDAFRMVTQFRTQTATIIMVARAGYLPIPDEECWAVVVCSAVVQSLGALAVLCERQELQGCVALICWCCVHPAIYAQMGNGEFVAETISVIGGLCILLSHLKAMRASHSLLPTGPSQLPGAPASDGLCLLGRILLCSYFAYYGCAKLRSIVLGELSFHASVVETLLMVALAYVCVLIVVGSRSRRMAIGLAIVMFASNLVFHPFWYFWAIGHHYVAVGDLRAIETRLPIDLSLLGKEPLAGASVLSVSDHERYFFFQRLSTVGALLLLAAFGPGRHSVDEPSAPVRIERFTGKGRD
jgi:uncharacterized membrane protein YphA (DoxX/SURF4 family)